VTTPVGPEQIWDQLLQSGAAAVTAVGIMANWVAESNLNPEAVNPADSNGYPSYGLSQWNTASYPNAATLVTGNPANDLVAQVTFFFQTVPQSALTGSTPQQVASNIAANYERCSTCQPGGASNEQRQDYATEVAGWAAAGNWPTSSSQGATTVQLDAAQTAQETAAATTAQSNCAWGVNWALGSGLGFLGGLVSGITGGGSSLTSGEICLITKSEVRAVLGAAFLGLGGMFAFIVLMNMIGHDYLGAVNSLLGGGGGGGGAAAGGGEAEGAAEGAAAGGAAEGADLAGVAAVAAV
jgi:Phage tail lysozyme